MSILNNSLLLGAPAAATGYSISRSIRLNAPDSAFLSRTPGSAGNRRTWTWAGWVKRSAFSRGILFASTQNGSNLFALEVNSDKLDIYDYATTFQWRLNTTAVFRDPSAWMHICFALDTTQATSANRAKLYINGVQVSTFDTASYPSLDYQGFVNTTNVHDIGSYGGGTGFFFNGYLADIHFIDGQALTPTSFGEFSATTGVWVPKAYTGSYGTNGFRLDFSDNSAATATALGKDRAGSNNWTPNNLSVTAGAGNDSLVDVPTNGSEVDTGLGGEVKGNYATWNPNYPSLSGISYAEGNLQATYVSGGSRVALGTIDMPRSGKWYYEITRISGGSFSSVGLWNNVIHNAGGFTVSNYRTYRNNGNKESDPSTSISYGSSYTAGDTIGVAVDMDNGAIYFAKNGTWQNSGVPTSGASKTGAAFTDVLNVSSWTPGVYFDAGAVVGANFGQRPFAYAAPSGFKALCTANLPAPLVTKPSDVFDVKLYTGNGGTQTISGLGFSPDLVWLKSRSSGGSSFTNHVLVDSVRGAGSFGLKNLYSNTTESEFDPSSTATASVTALNSDGFALGGNANTNTNTMSAVAWAWDAGSTTVTNTQGSITSSVRANATAGFSIVTYTGNGSAGATVGHGLGVAPSLIIQKERSQGTGGWNVYHAALGATQYLQLNRTDAAISSANQWNNTAPSSTVFTMGSSGEVNDNGQTNVAYCFAPVAGYSSFGSYTGNGSADGPFVYTGFRPRWILIKNPSMASDWVIFDSARSPVNALNDYLAPNSSSAEGVDYTPSDIDFLSNGFKLRGTWSGQNGSAVSIIFAAFAESPFQYARAR